MKKLLTANLILLCMIVASVTTVFADSGKSSLNIPFIVIVCLLAPILIGVIVYYILSAKKQKKLQKDKEVTKIIRDYDDK